MAAKCKNINKNIYIFIIALILAFTFTNFNVTAFPHAVTLELELIFKNYNIPVNSTHSYSNFSFSLTSQQFDIYIASINGKLSLLPSLNINISLISQNHPLSIGLEALSPIFLQFSSPAIDFNLTDKNTIIVLTVNFQLFVVGDENFGKIVPKSAIFNETTNKVELIPPSGAVWYTISYPDETRTTFGFTFSIFIIPALILTRRLKRKRN
jgi:hypothetical protein